MQHWVGKQFAASRSLRSSVQHGVETHVAASRPGLVALLCFCYIVGFCCKQIGQNESPGRREAPQSIIVLKKVRDKVDFGISKSTYFVGDKSTAKVSVLSCASAHALVPA